MMAEKLADTMRDFFSRFFTRKYMAAVAPNCAMVDIIMVGSSIS